ncbi:hypothetical protein IEQ34_012035 [Dendrobium chrysotoxum]|uniref:Uncharacterized protein n=1 Tax=Dendrobium chrysotoxum TaxID=161865 RepID=A0AAV7GRH5_DENCH|nr:hypothetical protein IEQ34_012035 [Dendrobium chrysotoxum]
MSVGRYMAFSPSPSTAPHSPHITGLRTATAIVEQEKYALIGVQQRLCCFLRFFLFGSAHLFGSGVFLGIFKSQNENLQLLRETRQPMLAQQEKILLPQNPPLAKDAQPEHLHVEIPLPQSRGRPRSQQDIDLVSTSNSIHPSHPSWLAHIPSDVPEDLA